MSPNRTSFIWQIFAKALTYRSKAVVRFTQSISRMTLLRSIHTQRIRSHLSSLGISGLVFAMLPVEGPILFCSGSKTLSGEDLRLYMRTSVQLEVNLTSK